MACTIRAQKITLQIISLFYLICAVIGIVVAIILLLDANAASKNPSEFLKQNMKTTKFMLWFILIKSTLMAIISIFGIYYVAKENASKIKVYCIIHVFLLILNILSLFSNFGISAIITILLSFGAVYLSFELEQSYYKRNKNLDSINPV